MEEIGDRQLITREITQVVQDLPTWKSSHEIHVDENIQCVICRVAKNCDECETCENNDYCSLSCNEDVPFHRNCFYVILKFWRT